MATLVLPAGAKAIIQSLVNGGLGPNEPVWAVPVLAATSQLAGKTDRAGGAAGVDHALHEGGHGGGGLRRDRLQPRLGLVGARPGCPGSRRIWAITCGVISTPPLATRAGHQGHLQGRWRSRSPGRWPTHTPGMSASLSRLPAAPAARGLDDGHRVGGHVEGDLLVEPERLGLVQQGWPAELMPDWAKAASQDWMSSCSRVPPHRPRRGSWSAAGAGCRCWAG